MRCGSWVETGTDEAAINAIGLHLHLFLLILLLPCFYIMHVKSRWPNCKRRLTNDWFTLHYKYMFHSIVLKFATVISVLIISVKLLRRILMKYFVNSSVAIPIKELHEIFRFTNLFLGCVDALHIIIRQRIWLIYSMQSARFSSTLEVLRVGYIGRSLARTKELTRRD